MFLFLMEKDQKDYPSQEGLPKLFNLEGWSSLLINMILYGSGENI